MNPEALIAQWQQEAQEPFAGWDFAHLKGRMLEDQPPWDYLERAAALMQQSSAVLDIDTGGGEKLLSLRESWPQRVIATEGYAPNIRAGGGAPETAGRGRDSGAGGGDAALRQRSLRPAAEPARRHERAGMCPRAAFRRHFADQTGAWPVGAGSAGRVRRDPALAGEHAGADRRRFRDRRTEHRGRCRTGRGTCASRMSGRLSTT